MNSITRIFSAAAILLFIFPPGAASQSERSHAIVEIKTVETTLSGHGNDQRSRLRVFAGERYVGYQNDAVSAGGRLINIFDTVFFIPNGSTYKLEEATSPDTHRAGLLRKPMITRLTKGGVEYYRLDVTTFKTHSDTVVIRTFRGSEILTFITQNWVDIERSKIEPHKIIRISATRELTKFYELPPYEQVEINRDYYQAFTRIDLIECFWEKESGFLYELKGNQLVCTQTASESRPIIAEGLGNRRLIMYKGADWESENISGKRTNSFFDSGLSSSIERNPTNVFAIIIYLGLLIIIIIIRYDWIEKVTAKSWSRFTAWAFPTFIHELNSNDSLQSLSDQFKVGVDEILKHNPKAKGIRKGSSLFYYGFKTVKIPKSKKPRIGSSNENEKRNEDLQGQNHSPQYKNEAPIVQEKVKGVELNDQAPDRLQIKLITTPQNPFPKVLQPIMQTDASRKKTVAKTETEEGQKKKPGEDVKPNELSSIFATLSREMELQKKEIVEMKKNHDQTRTFVNTLSRINNDLSRQIENLNEDTTGLKQQLDELIEENHNLREKLNQFLI